MMFLIETLEEYDLPLGAFITFGCGLSKTFLTGSLAAGLATSLLALSRRS